MPIYSYHAKDASGKQVKAHEFAVSREELKGRLNRRGLFIVSIQEKKEKRGVSTIFKKRIKIEALVLLCKQLATMLKGGVPLIRAIGSIADELKDPTLQEVLSEMNYRIKGGESFSESLKRFPRLFSSLFIAMAEAGEKTGSLDMMLERLSSYMQARDRLNKKIISAMIYPGFIVSFFFFAMAVFTLFLIPRFRSIYSGFGANLPAITQIVFGISDFVIHYFLILAATLAAIVFFTYKYFFRTKKGRRQFDKLVLHIPLFGAFLRNAALSKFSRTLATLLNQGIPIATSIELVGRTADNTIIEEASIKVRNLILDGENIQEALKKSDIFPPLMIQMVSVGVESGSLPELLDKASDFYEERVDSFISLLTSMMEPVLLAVLGVIVGFMVIALYMPIFRMSQAVATGGR